MDNQAKQVTSSNEIQEAVVRLISDKSNKYHLTLSPRIGFSLAFLEKSFNLLLKFMNEMLYGKRYMRQGNHVQGIVVLEHSDKSNPHFHLIIRDPNNDLESKYTLKEALERSLVRIRVSSTASDAIRLIGPQSFCLQSYYNSGEFALEKYLAKEFKTHRLRAESNLDNLSTLNANGAEFGMRKEHNYPAMYRLTAAVK